MCWVGLMRVDVRDLLKQTPPRYLLMSLLKLLLELLIFNLFIYIDLLLILLFFKNLKILYQEY